VLVMQAETTDDLQDVVEEIRDETGHSTCSRFDPEDIIEGIASLRSEQMLYSWSRTIFAMPL